MKFFVSAENSSYNHWQLELLLESFKSIYEQNNLIISLYDTGKEEKHKYKINLNNHPLKFTFKDLRRYPYYPLNDFYGIKFALESGLLTTPFMFVKPDQILYQNAIQNENYDLILNVEENPGFTYHDAIANIPFIDKYIFHSNFWCPFSYPIIFNSIDIDKLIDMAESLIFEQINKLSRIWKHTDRLAIMLYHLVNKKSFTMNSFCQNLLSNTFYKNFINYEHGLPPDFHKVHFTYENELLLSSRKNPFEAIIEKTPTKSSYLFAEIAKSYLKKYENSNSVQN
jgi:hypothetical protein